MDWVDWVDWVEVIAFRLFAANNQLTHFSVVARHTDVGSDSGENRVAEGSREHVGDGGGDTDSGGAHNGGSSGVLELWEGVEEGQQQQQQEEQEQEQEQEQRQQERDEGRRRGAAARVWGDSAWSPARDDS